MDRGKVTFEVVEELAVLSDGNNGWSKKVKLVKWNNGQTKLDIRDWNEDRDRVGKGITLNYEEYQLLKNLLENEDLDF